jgi:AhpD family alkylhydroperoxidase
MAHVTKCSYRIRSHATGAKLKDVTGKKIMEAIWIPAEMRASGSHSHSALAIDTMNEEEPRPEQ